MIEEDFVLVLYLKKIFFYVVSFYKNGDTLVSYGGTF